MRLALTDRQRDMLLSDLNRKVDRILALLDPPKDDHPPAVRKRDPRALYGSGAS
jgi:hypothetical protein